jgi:hypothetical protein
MTTLLNRIVKEVQQENLDTNLRRYNRQNEMLRLCKEIESALHDLGFDNAQANRDSRPTGRRDVKFTLGNSQHEEFVVGVFESDSKPKPLIAILPPAYGSRDWVCVPNIEALESVLTPLIKDRVSNAYFKSADFN